MKLINFFLFLIIFSILWTIYLKPYKISPKNIKDIPEVVFENFILNEIEKNGTKSTLIGKIGEKYKDRFEIKDFEYKKNDKNIENLIAKKGVYKKDIINLYDSIEYKTKDFKFYTDMAVYNLKKEIISTKTKFKLITKSAIVLGDNLIYYRNKGKILAKNINAKIKNKK
ncbi:LPS export ABC transporter periplasmic protein LptC [Nitrosophilus kaiyonis]|uniref:LPS export ABC transporter periplasmic protein LptC n=1 Tax=Nitrosophilus kaiyonis TaxID=2930200 RepID=UPI002493AA2D|nr:LPS export ABC transporter periplasmic protein LptC [Nitrosophilus kaiyonis]